MTELEKAIGYTFRDRELLLLALTHSSYANEKRGTACNERLEFLGDSILGFAAAKRLYRLHPDKPEGELSRIRADLVCEKSLAVTAARIGLGAHLRLGHGEDAAGGRSRSSILADAVEAVIAAVYLDGGLDTAVDLVERLILSAEVPELRFTDYKTMLQELVQRDRDASVAYELIEESGPDHAKRFTVRVCVNGREVGVGTGKSKKNAQQAAAHAAVSALFPEALSPGSEK